MVNNKALVLPSGPNRVINLLLTMTALHKHPSRRTLHGDPISETPFLPGEDPLLAKVR